MSAVKEQFRPARSKVDPVAALSGFFRIAEAWGVTAQEARIILGAPAERTYYAWRVGNAVRVPADTLRRIGYVAGIYKALQILYSDPISLMAGSSARTWRWAARRRCNAWSPVT
jgi:hypothetical protein